MEEKCSNYVQKGCTYWQKLSTVTNGRKHLYYLTLLLKFFWARIYAAMAIEKCLQKANI